MSEVAKNLQPQEEQKTGVSEVVTFSVGNNKAQIDASKLPNTSKIPLPNTKQVLINGKLTNCGYISNSAIDTYMRCPRQYYHRYVAKTPGRLLPKSKLWSGAAVHNACDKLLKSVVEKKVIPKEEFLKEISLHIQNEIDTYKAQFQTAKTEGKDPMELTFGSRIENEQQLHNLFRSVGNAFYDSYLPKVKPKAIEDLFIMDFEVKSGGTLKVVGFIDLIEEWEGREMITDHKTGQAWNQQDVETNQQLTLYSMAKKVSDVSVNSLAVGTTGGKSADKAKPATFLKLSAKKSIKDWERTWNNVNMVLEGIKNEVFPLSGISNPICCDASQCPYFQICLGK